MSIGQSTHQNLVQNLACGAFFPMKNTFLHQKSADLGCIWFEVSYSVHQFIGGENDSNSDTEWSQRHNLYQTVIKKVPNNKPFVKSNLLRYKSHNTISILNQLIRNNIQHGECLAYILQILTLGNCKLCAGNKSFPHDAALRPQPRPMTPASQYLSQNKTIQWLVPPLSLPSATISQGDCRAYHRRVKFLQLWADVLVASLSPCSRSWNHRWFTLWGPPCYQM